MSINGEFEFISDELLDINVWESAIKIIKNCNLK